MIQKFTKYLRGIFLLKKSIRNVLSAFQHIVENKKGISKKTHCDITMAVTAKV